MDDERMVPECREKSTRYQPGAIPRFDLTSSPERGTLRRPKTINGKGGGESMSPVLGKKAPDFILPDQDGKQVRLKDYAGKWVVLYFYSKDNTSG
jgi:hypothetical protein